MPRVNLPPGCFGFADGDRKYIAERGPGSFINLEDGSPQLAKLRGQDYASAGLVDAGPEKFFTVRRDDGRWCPPCRFLAHAWAHACPKCGRDTVPESQMPARELPAGPYTP
jgi:hypothetical protein